MSQTARRRFWGWGLEGHGPTEEQQAGIAKTAAARFGVADADLTPLPRPRIEDVTLREPRLALPASKELAEICSVDPYDRAGHSYGKSYRDSVRGARREFDHPPDIVAFPATRPR